jgi:hypothetical protein
MFGQYPTGGTTSCAFSSNRKDGLILIMLTVLNGTDKMQKEQNIFDYATWNSQGISCKKEQFEDI